MSPELDPWPGWPLHVARDTSPAAFKARDFLIARVGSVRAHKMKVAESQERAKSAWSRCAQGKLRIVSHTSKAGPGATRNHAECHPI